MQNNNTTPGIPANMPISGEMQCEYENPTLCPEHMLSLIKESTAIETVSRQVVRNFCAEIIWNLLDF